MTSTSMDRMEEIELEVFEKAFNEGELSIIDETHAEDYVGHWIRPDMKEIDVEALKEWFTMIHEAFPDIRFETTFVSTGEDMVTVGYTATGTHEGQFLGIPPTGKTGTTTGIMTHRYEDGKVVEGYGAWDGLGMMQQLGVVPEEFHLTDFMETAYNLTKQDVLKRTRQD